MTQTFVAVLSMTLVVAVLVGLLWLLLISKWRYNPVPNEVWIRVGSETTFYEAAFFALPLIHEVHRVSTAPVPLRFQVELPLIRASFIVHVQPQLPLTATLAQGLLHTWNSDRLHKDLVPLLQMVATQMLLQEPDLAVKQPVLFSDDLRDVMVVEMERYGLTVVTVSTMATRRPVGTDVEMEP